MFDFKSHFLRNPDYRFKDNIFYSTNFSVCREFEETYITMRDYEGRLYADADVLKLPNSHIVTPNANEWKIRERSAGKLMKRLRAKEAKNIVDIGCGNGWMINYLSKRLPGDYCGTEINEVELRQAARLFGNADNISFLYTDIHQNLFTTGVVDAFILGGVIQYFSNLTQILKILLKALAPGGEIHLIDSPVYSESEVKMAMVRGNLHFEETNHSNMKRFYFYQKWSSITKFNYEIRYDPRSIVQTVKRLAMPDSPFPWVVVNN